MFQQPSFQATPSHQPAPFSSFNYNHGSLMERGAVAVRQKYDFFRNIWGVPEDLERMMQSNGNMQAIDIISQYKDRALQVPSAQLTAGILNAQGGWLSETVAPFFPTNEFRFTSQFREMNQIEFSKTAVGGIPHEQTFRTTSWSSTIEKVQLNARIEMDLAHDTVFGEGEWMFQLQGLASNAMLTIHKHIAYSLIHMGYTNVVGDHVKTNAYDLSRVLAYEEETFGAAALDQTKFLRMIRRVRDKIPDFDTVIIPYQAVAYLAELQGESTSMQAQKAQMDQVTGQVQWEFLKGRQSAKTVTYGDEVIHFVEMPQFRVNMTQDSNREQILRTSVTLGQVIQCDPDIKIDTLDPGALRRDNLDFYVFQQTKNQGDEVKVAFTDALDAAFYWDETKRDGIHDAVHSFCRFKNTQVQQDPSHIPWRYNQMNKHHVNDGNLNTESGFDYDRPNVDDLYNKEKLLEMRGWRDQFFGLTYVPDKREYRVPKRVVDFPLDVLPNRAIHKSAKAIAHVANIIASRGMDFDGMMNETYRLLADIDNSPWTDEYIIALINANIEKMFNFNELTVDTTDPTKNGLPKFNPAVREEHEEYKDENGNIRTKFINAAKLSEWRGDRFGSLELPKKNGKITQIYPPGFGSGPGLERLAQEASDDTSEWREVGLRAKRVVDFLDMFDTLIREYIGPTDVNDEGLTPPWFHVSSPIAVLVDSFRHYKAPVFLGLPSAASLLNKQTALTPIQAKEFCDAVVKDTVTNLKDNKSVKLPVSNIAKFIVIVDAALGIPTGGKSVGQKMFGVKAAKLAKTDAYLQVLNKLLEYTINSVYNQMGGDISMTLKTILFISKKLTDAKTDSECLAVNEMMDTIFSINTGKKNKDAITKLVKDINDDKTIPDNAIAVAAIVKTMQEREKKDREDFRLTVFDGTHSYDDQVRALDDVVRLTGSADPRDTKRLTEATAIVNTMTRKTPKALQNRMSISVDAMSTPDTFLRAPLVAGDRLLEYMQRTQNPLIKPADPAVFFEAPLEIYTNETMRNPTFTAQKKGARVPHTALPFSQIFRQGINGVAFGARPEREEFSVKSRGGSRQQPRDIREFINRESSGFSKPAFDDMDDDYHSLSQKRRETIRKPFKMSGEKDEDFAKRERDFKFFLESDEYFGPHESRYDYIDTISSPFEKAIFKAIMLAPNRITIHKKLSAIGQKLVNVLIFRLFIQHIMSSAIVMKAGKDTVKTAVGHSRVWANTEQRGYCVINASFYLGIVPVNPNGVQMLPFVFPDGFVGGMGTTFMKNKDHFRYRTNDKESMIAMIVPITESKYEFPLQMLNLPTYSGRDSNNAPHNRKWSSYEFFAHVFGYNMLCDVHGQIIEAKRSYGHAYDISLCAHRSPVRYIGSEGRERYVAGTGPRGNLRMAIAGAEKTFSGERVKFPDLQSTLITRQ